MSQMVFEVTVRAPEPHQSMEVKRAYRPSSLLFSDDRLILPSLQETYCTMPGVTIEDKRAEGGMFIVRRKDGKVDIFDVTRRHICTMPEHF